MSVNTAVPTIRIYQLPSAPGGSDVTDYLCLERETTPGVFVTYKIAVSQMDLTTLPYYNSNLPVTNTIGSALSRALIPAINNIEVDANGPYGSGATALSLDSASYDYFTLNLRLNSTPLLLALDVPAGVKSQRPIMVRLLANGDNTNSGYTGISAVQIQNSSAFFWATSEPSANATPGLVNLNYGQTAVLIFTYCGSYGSSKGFQDWIAEYFVPGGSTGMSGNGSPQGVVLAPAGTTYVDKIAEAIYWNVDGTTTGWRP